MTLIGIDGCRGGWVQASSDPELGTVIFSVLDDLAATFDPARDGQVLICIDIPIGLPTGRSRTCDLEARRRLGTNQGSRVFPAPTRASLGGRNYAECCALNRAAAGVAISKQAHGILPKIAEVDGLITPQLQATAVREVHPEVTFCVLNGSALLHGKKTVEGQQERLEILKRHGVIFDPVRERTALGRSRVAIDDLIDAGGCLISARRVREGKAIVLGDDTTDQRGLRMEIVA